jgi:hypothetical protein
MKYILILSAALLSVVSGYGQEYMDKIAQKSCECLDKVPDTLKTDEFNLKLGICMIEAATPYKKQLKKDQGINLDNIDTEGEKLGRLIGIKMASTCPNILLKLTQKPSDKEEAAAEEKTAEGLITKLENDFFVVLSLKDEAGKINRFYWLTFVESGMELTSKYKSVVGESVIITYKVQDFFDPKIEEYRAFNIISKLEVVRK